MSPMTVTDPRFDSENQMIDEPSKRRNKWAPCLIGCLIVIVGGILLAALVAFWISRNWRGPAAAVAEQALNEGINQSDLPPQERQEVKAEAKRAIDAFRDGQMTLEQLGKIVEGITQSPLLTLFVVTAIEKQYLDQSGLTDEEKADGRRSLQRFVRGAADKKIEQKGIDAVMAHIADRQPDGSWQIRQKVSDKDLRAALKEAKAQADAAGIPEEPEEFDPSDELRKIIDESMGVPAAMPAEPAPQ